MTAALALGALALALFVTRRAAPVGGSPPAPPLDAAALEDDAPLPVAAPTEDDRMPPLVIALPGAQPTEPQPSALRTALGYAASAVARLATSLAAGATFRRLVALAAELRTLSEVASGIAAEAATDAPATLRIRVYALRAPAALDAAGRAGLEAAFATARAAADRLAMPIAPTTVSGPTVSPLPTSLHLAPGTFT